MSEASATSNGPKFEQAYLAELRLQNVRSFGPDAKVDFRDAEGKVARWTVIVGENATGKSTLLECIYGITTETQENTGSDGNDLPGEIKFTFRAPRPSQLNLTYESLQIEGGWAHDLKGINKELKLSYYKIYAYSTDWHSGSESKGIGNPSFVQPYQANRRISELRLEAGRDLEDRSSFLTPVPQLIDDPLEALLRLDYSQAKGQIPLFSLEKAVSLLKKLLPEVREVEIAPISDVTNNITVSFLFGSIWVPAYQSGYGYLSTLAWVFDLAFKLAKGFPELEDPLQAPAVCLVDEIDLHLHPKWQRTIVKTLLDTFPNVQFIVTAHSPIIVQASAGHNIVLLRRNEEAGIVEIVNDVDEVANWSLDQIVTSALFGFASAQAPNQAEWVRRQTELLAKPDRTEAEEEELQRLQEAPQLPRGETQEEVELNRRIADTLARLQERSQAR